MFVTNLSKIGLLMFLWQHIFELALMRNQPIQLSNDVTVTLFLNQSSQNFVFLFFIARGTSVQTLCKIGQETKKLQKIGNDVIVTSFLKIAQQFFVCEYFVLILIDVISLKLIKVQIKELQGGGTKHPPPPG